jgi:hypothetical protein
MKKEVNHGEHGGHGEKAMNCTLLATRQLGDAIKAPGLSFSVSSVFSVVKMGFQG